MQLPFGLNPTVDARPEMPGRAVFTHPGQVLSLESQLRLRELYEYMEYSRDILSAIQVDLSLFQLRPEDPGVLRKVAERMGRFCLEADSWGFSALYQIGMGLQVLLLDSSSCAQEGVFRNTLDRGLAMLSALLEHCESDFRWRLAIADMQDSLNQLSHN